MIIGIDLDSTLNNLAHTWLARYNADYADSVTPSDILTWDTHLYVKCGKDIYQYLTPDLFSACAPQPYAQVITQSLLAQGHELVIITSTIPETHAAKHTWVKTHFPWITHYIATDSKQFIDVDVLLDDGPHNLEAFHTHRPHKHAIAFDYPYNRTWRGARVCNWTQVPSVIERVTGHAL